MVEREGHLVVGRFKRFPVLEVWVRSDALSVAAIKEGECWDYLLDLDASPILIEHGVLCGQCFPSKLFPDRSALYRDPLFESFGRWVAENLHDEADGVDIVSFSAGGATMAQLRRRAESGG